MTDSKEGINEIAGKLMITDFPIIDSSKRISDAKDLISKDINSFDNIDYIYVVDQDKTLKGILSIKDIFRCKKDQIVTEAMNTHFVSVRYHTDQEHASILALKNNLKSIPVVDKTNKLLGIIPPRVLLKILHNEHIEDILLMGGISKSHKRYKSTTEVPIHTLVWQRTPWLLIGLIGIMIAAGFIGVFEEALSEFIILAFFIPAIVYLSDSLGSQNVTLCVRDLASADNTFNRWAYFLRQTLVSVFLGLIISLATFIIIALFWKENYAGFVIAFSLFFAAIITNLTSLAIVILIEKMGKDPAYASGPFATVISDISSIIIYLLIASWLLM